MPRPPFPADLEDVSKLLTELQSDLKLAIAGIVEKEKVASQFSLRTFVRNVFAGVEGAIGVFKRDALLRGVGVANFNTAEVAALMEESFEVNDRGEVQRLSKRIRFKSNVRLTLRAMQRTMLAQDWKPDFSSQGWECFSKAVDVRDRITHPRTPADLRVAPVDLADVLMGLEWWQETVREMAHALERDTNERIRRFMEEEKNKGEQEPKPS